jgi:menaquinol-cytochrome c reductase iron-sulfur subunit
MIIIPVIIIHREEFCPIIQVGKAQRALFYDDIEKETVMAKTPHLSRNDFVKTVTAALGTIIGVVVGAPAIGYVISPALKITASQAWIPLGPLENFPVGVPTLSSFTRTKVNGWERTTNSYGVYVYRSSDTEVVAYSNVCTHLACRVNWKEDLQLFVCPCHDGRFDINGKVTKDPPPRPLDRYETKIEEGKLSIFFKEG